MTNPVFDQKDLRATMGQFCTGVVVVPAAAVRGHGGNVGEDAGEDAGESDGNGDGGDHPAAFVAQSFVSLSLDPPLIAVCPAKSSSSWPKIRAAGAFCVNMLHSEQVELCNQFARSGGDKFQGVDWRPGKTGAPVLADALAWVECTLDNELEAGDHTIAIGRVQGFQRLEEGGDPLLFFRGGYGTFAPT